LAEEGETLDAFIEQTGPGGDVQDMTLGLFSGFGEGKDRINLSTLHSAKGREFAVVVLFGMDNGRIPRRGASGTALLEARRLFYVGFTRPETELHLMYTAAQLSPFVQEVQDRLTR
jgi:DNA helicase-2/ATP-dependent DNA helicase PcrA